MKDWIRNALSIRQQRRHPPSGPVPSVGTQIIRANVRATITQDISRDLWNWMLLSGWRAVPVKNDRRQCHDLPPGALDALIAAPPSERDMAHRRMLAAVDDAEPQ
jgi:hypothetical protein